jgi:hypothetical protein
MEIKIMYYKQDNEPDGKATDKPEEGSYIMEDNLEAVFAEAIRSLRAYEATISPTFQSAFRACIEKNYEYLRKHKYLNVIPR